MSIRNITRKENIYTNPWALGVLEFPKEKNGIIYVRQSSLTQQQNNIHSYEMQTDKFLEHFRNMGCTGRIEIVPDDEAMSGTLDIHKRPGLTRVVHMIERKEIGWIGAVHVNRLTRDPWLITPSVLMKLCYDHDVWISTLRMHFNFKDEYCQRVFMLEAEESARHLKWMKLVLGGAKSTASDSGYYDGRYIAPGYIVDRSDPQRKRYIVYRPHAEIVCWLFQRFLELDGNFPQLCREVEQMPYVFPQFESWVDPKTVSRFSLNRKGNNRTGEGNFRLFRNGLESILTNPVYIGWWIPLDGGMIEHNHEPLIEEPLFTFAHSRLSSHSLSGERQKPARITRHSAVDALLKKVLKDPEGTPIYALRANGGLYICREAQGRLITQAKFAVSIQAIDTVFLEKFFERIQSLGSDMFDDWEDKIEKIRAAKEEKEGLIRKGIKEADLKMKRINELLTNTDIETPLPKSMIDDLVRQYTGLEAKQAELKRELQENPEEEEENEEILFEIGGLIPRIMALWESLPLEKRVRFIGALVRRVILSRATSGWLKMEIHWKMLDWETDIAHIRRGWSGIRWTREEETHLQEIYSTEDAGDILKAFPTRSWRAIKAKAFQLNLPRLRKEKNCIPVNSPDFLDMSHEDMEYAANNDLVLTTKNVQWSRSRE